MKVAGRSIEGGNNHGVAGPRDRWKAVAAFPARGRHDLLGPKLRGRIVRRLPAIGVALGRHEHRTERPGGSPGTPEGREREAIVDQLCDAAAAGGIRIVRDKTVLRTGDRISQFMYHIGTGGRVFVILSDKYLRSGFCMYELFEICRNSRWDDRDFLSRIRVYALPDAAIFGVRQRLEYAISWKQRFEEIDELTRQHGADLLGPRDFNEFRLMKQFYLNVSEVLATIADLVLPRTFEQLRGYGLADIVLKCGEHG
jgi:hypothetical protein